MNKCTFMGRVSSEITVYQKEDKISIRFNMALNVYNAKEKKNESEFIRCVAFGKNAENINKFFHKGSPILIESHVSNGSYEKDGITRYTTDFVVDHFEFPPQDKSQNSQSQGESAPAPAAPAPGAPAPAPSAPAPAMPDDGFMNIDDSGLPWN